MLGRLYIGHGEASYPNVPYGKRLSPKSSDVYVSIALSSFQETNLGNHMMSRNTKLLKKVIEK